MATIPRYDRGVLPSGEGVGSAVPANDAVAKAIGGVADQAARVAEMMYRKAEEQRKQVQAVQFATIKGDLDRWHYDTLASETENPDYEGLKGRYAQGLAEKRKAIFSSIRDRELRGAVEEYLAMRTPSMEYDVAKLYLKKQEAHRDAGFQAAYDTLVKNLDYGGLEGLVASASWIPEDKRQELLIRGREQVSWNAAILDMRRNPEEWTFDPDRYPSLTEAQRASLESEHRGLLNGIRAEQERAQRERWRKGDEQVWGVVLKGGSVSRSTLQAMVKRGDLSVEQAARWADHFEAEAERSAARAERLKNAAFRARYEKATPIEHEYLDLSAYGTTPEEANRTYESIRKTLEADPTRTDLIQSAYENGKIGRLMVGRLKGLADTLSTVAGGKLEGARKEARARLTSSLRGVGIKDSFAWGFEFDTETAGVTDPEEFERIRKRLTRKALEESGYSRISFLPAFGKKAKLYDETAGAEDDEDFF